jgi:hypothetical protein
VGAAGVASTPVAVAQTANGSSRETPMSLTQQWDKTFLMTVGGTHRFAMMLEDNPTARAFAQLLPLGSTVPIRRVSL